jgi:phosphoglycolate phosphatase
MAGYHPSMRSAVIFDLDGTLVDTLDDIASAMNLALVSRGLPVRTREEYRVLVGRGMRALAEDLIPPASRESGLVDTVASDAVSAYLASPARLSRAYEGIPELLLSLARRNISCAVLTNKAESVARAVVDALFPPLSFRLVRGDRSGFPAKPDPASALDVARLLGAGREEIVYLGDSETDVETAKNAGFFMAGAAWGFRGRDALTECGCGFVIDRPAELLALFG